jgi:hypothetical protein
VRYYFSRRKISRRFKLEISRLQDPQVDSRPQWDTSQDSRLKTLQDVKNGLKTAGFHGASSSRFQGSNISKSSRLKTSVGYCSRLKISRRFKLKISRLQRPQVLKTQDLGGILLKNKDASRLQDPQDASRHQDPQDASRRQESAQDRRLSRRLKLKISRT